MMYFVGDVIVAGRFGVRFSLCQYLWPDARPDSIREGR
jgi:hypothetical protein